MVGRVLSRELHDALTLAPYSPLLATAQAEDVKVCCDAIETDLYLIGDSDLQLSPFTELFSDSSSLRPLKLRSPHQNLLVNGYLNQHGQVLYLNRLGQLRLITPSRMQAVRTSISQLHW